MTKGKVFFDYDEPRAIPADPNVPLEDARIIRNVPFVDSPHDVEFEEKAKDVPYVPSETEWLELKAEIRRIAFSTGFAIGLGAAAFIFAIGALVTK
jgi:hypothetical protein